MDVPPEGADLAKLFALGQLVRAVVIEVRGGADEDDHPTTPAAAGGGGGGAKKAIGLSLRPSRLNEELSIEGLVKGQVLTCSVKSSEDHGYVVLTGASFYSQITCIYLHFLCIFLLFLLLIFADFLCMSGNPEDDDFLFLWLSETKSMRTTTRNKIVELC